MDEVPSELPSELTPEETKQVREMLRENNADKAKVKIADWLPKFCRPLGRVGKYFLWLSMAWKAYEVYMIPTNIQEGFTFYQSTYQWANQQISEYVESATQEQATADPERTTKYLVWNKSGNNLSDYSLADQFAVIPATGLPPVTLTGTKPISINLG